MSKVMVIDDDREFLDEISKMLQLSGYETIAISESRKALKKIQSLKPDVILLDLRMDGVSGFKIADTLSKNSKLKNIPIVGITGYYTEKEHKTYMTICGIAECLIKPFNPLDVIAAIESAVKLRK
ncbi:MAG: response regulator [Candidatus Kaelpia imicola]|nr:response regulator [Candidatus Kaelpia imicola]